MRVTYIFSSINSSLIIIAVMGVLCIYELILIFYCFRLSFANIKDDVDVLKNEASKIGYVQLFFEHQKWIYCLPKLDLIFGVFFCTSASGTSTSARCSANLGFSVSGLSYVVVLAFAIILFITTILVNLIIVMIYHNPEMVAVNQLKSRYSQFKQFEPVLEIMLVGLSYMNNASLLFIIGNVFGIFLLIEYFTHFPLMDKNISDIYGWLILVYEMFVVLFVFREYSSSLKDTNFPIIMFILMAVLYGVLKAIWSSKIIFSMTVDPNRLGDFPKATCLYLEKLCELYELNQISLSSKLILFGSLSLHKTGCRVETCPCKDITYNLLAGEEKPTMSGGMVIDLGKDIKIKGVDFARICGNSEIFERWFYSFVDFQYEIMIAHLIRKNMETIVQEVCLRYWFFLIKVKKNQIKALYQNKIMNSLLKKKDTFFATVERSLTNLIESKIREKDKAHSYSYSQKDRGDAQNNLKFDKMVFSETEKDRLKKILGMIIFEKCDYMEQMIKGFKSLEEMRLKTITLIGFTEYFEKIIQMQIEQNRSNLFFLKFSSLMKAYILFDPLSCRDSEQEVEDILNREKSIDSLNTITSLSILQGNVGSIIASFKNIKENGKILKFSEKIPQIFRYNKGEFQTKISVTELIPDCIGRLHDQFLTRLVQTGIAKTVRNYRTMFAKDRDGYIFMVKLFINYYFVKQDDFAFSALIINVPSNNMYLLIDEQGYLEGLSENYIDMCKGYDIDVQYYKKCHTSIFIPQFTEFIQQFNQKEEYSFLKFRMDLPKEMNKYISHFIQHHSNYYHKMNTHHEEWLKNLESFSNTRTMNKDNSYEITVNIKHEIFQDNGKEVMFFIIEILSFIVWEEAYTSLYTASTNKSRNEIEKKENLKKKQLTIQHTQKDKEGIQEENSKVEIESQALNMQDPLIQKEFFGNKYEDLATQKSLTQTIPLQVINKQDSKSQFSQKSPQYKHLLQIDQEEKGVGLSTNLDESNVHFLNNSYNLDTQNVNNTLMNTQSAAAEDKMVQELTFQQIDENSKNDSFLQSDPHLKLQKKFNQMDANDQILNDNQPLNNATQHKGSIDQHLVLNKQDDESSHNDSQHKRDNHSKKESYEVEDDKKDPLKMTSARKAANNDLQFDQGSKSNSVQSSTSSILRTVIKNTTDKSIPPFINILYIVFAFQFLVFTIVVIVLSVTTSQSFNSYTSALNEMGRSAKLLIPISQALLSSDLLALSNQKLIQIQSSTYIPFMIEHINQGYQDYALNLFSLMEKQVQYMYQTEIYQYQVEAEIQSTVINQDIQMYFTEFLKLVGDELFDLGLTKTIDSVQILQPSRTLLKNNLNATYTFLDKVAIQISNDLNVLQNSIITVNTYSTILAVVLIIISFIFVIPSYKNLKFKSERVLMVVSRMKEQETSEIVTNLRQMGLKLYSDNDEYLHMDFTNLTLREENELKSSQRLDKKSRNSRKKRENYLFDRIVENQLKFYTFIITLFLLCILSILFFLIVTFFSYFHWYHFFNFEVHLYLLLFNKIYFEQKQIFIYLNQFSSMFGVPATKYQLYIEGIMCYSVLSSSNNMLLLNNFLSGDSINYITSNKYTEIDSLTHTCYQNSRSYFSTQYGNVQDSGSGLSFRSQIQQVNQNAACGLGILNKDYVSECNTAQQGVLNRGLSQAITSSLDLIYNQMNLGNGFQFLLNSQDYQDGIIVQLLILDFMRAILNLFETENVNIKDQFLNILDIIIIIGCILYIILFSFVIGYYIKQLNQEYLMIKRAIQLIPYKRLTEDQMTFFLLKKIMDI